MKIMIADDENDIRNLAKISPRRKRIYRSDSAKRQKTDFKRSRIMHPIVFLPLFIAVIIAVSSCSAQKGSIIVLENPDGTGFTMDLKEWSSNNKCELSLSEGDVLQVEIVLEEGEISLTIRGENGAEPYAGNNLESMKFTVTVSETDKYITNVTGKNATGKITVKK